MKIRDLHLCFVPVYKRGCCMYCLLYVCLVEPSAVYSQCCYLWRVCILPWTDYICITNDSNRLVNYHAIINWCLFTMFTCIMYTYKVVNLFRFLCSFDLIIFDLMKLLSLSLWHFFFYYFYKASSKHIILLHFLLHLWSVNMFTLLPNIPFFLL